jgi:hypothetical protein
MPLLLVLVLELLPPLPWGSEPGAANACLGAWAAAPECAEYTE